MAPHTYTPRPHLASACGSQVSATALLPGHQPGLLLPPTPAPPPAVGSRRGRLRPCPSSTNGPAAGGLPVLSPSPPHVPPGLWGSPSLTWILGPALRPTPPPKQGACLRWVSGELVCLPSSARATGGSGPSCARAAAWGCPPSRPRNQSRTSPEQGGLRSCQAALSLCALSHPHLAPSVPGTGTKSEQDQDKPGPPSGWGGAVGEKSEKDRVVFPVVLERARGHPCNRTQVGELRRGGLGPGCWERGRQAWQGI